MSARSNYELLNTSGEFHDAGRDHRGTKCSTWIPNVLSSDSRKLLQGQSKIIDLGGKNTKKVEQDQRVYIVNWFPEGLGIACMAMKYSQNIEQTFSHFPLTYFLEEDLVVAGVVLAGLASCLDVPFGTSCEDYKDYSELDKLYLTVLECWEKEPPDELASFFAKFRLE